MSEKETFYPKLDAKNDVVAREKAIIEYWKENKTFEKSVERRRGAEEFVFYDDAVRSLNPAKMKTIYD